MSTELITQDEIKRIREIDATARESRRQLRELKDEPMVRGLLIAKAIQRIRVLLTDEMMSDVMELLGTPLGIQVIPPGHKYERDVVRDVLIEGLLKGYRPVGGEIAVFSGGKMYPCAPGNLRLVQEWPGLTDLRVELGVPKTGEHGALVPVTATWRLNGVPDKIDCRDVDGFDRRIAVKVNSGMGVDAILGKAKAKLWGRIMAILTGAPVTTAEEARDGDVVDSTCTPLAEAEAETETEPVAEQATEMQQEPTLSPLDEAAAEFDRLEQIGDIARACRKLVASYPDYQDQIDAMAEVRCEQIREKRGGKAGKLFESSPTA